MLKHKNDVGLVIGDILQFSWNFSFIFLKDTFTVKNLGQNIHHLLELSCRVATGNKLQNLLNVNWHLENKN